MTRQTLTRFLIALVFAAPVAALAQEAILSPIIDPIPTPSRVVEAVNDTQLVRLEGNTHPTARPQFDKGLLEPNQRLDHMVLVLRRSPEQEKDLQSFNERQYNDKSPDFHHWLSAEEFGKRYGPSDTDIAAVTSWLQNHGFQIDSVSPGRINLEFSGTASQVQETFHVELHNYFVQGETHVANDRDPQIPRALAPVVTGIASLHDFFPKPQHIMGEQVKRNVKTGEITLLNEKPVRQVSRTIQPELGYVDFNGHVRMDVTPADFATIYNETPLFTAAAPIKGTGVTIAISGISDVSTADFNNFRSTFGLPATTLKVVHNGPDPGFDTKHGGQGENSLDVEWSGATAPGASITLIVSGSTATTFGGQLSDNYIVQNKIAPIMSASYGSCEPGLGNAGNAAYNTIWQQGATEGISIFESSGDQGSAGCSSQDVAAPNADIYGLFVNGMASSPFVTAVGGTDLNWQWWKTNGYQIYWNGTNTSTGATAKGYIPEIPWNSTCSSSVLLSSVLFHASNQPFPSSEALCNAVSLPANSAYLGLLTIGAGSGGLSNCVTSTTTTCTGSYAKPFWQVAPGVPAVNQRAVPDVSFFASGSYPAGLPGSAYLFCFSQTGSHGCTYNNNNFIIYQEIGGTSASSPAMAGVMALVVQKMGGAWQGLANPSLYKLAAKQSPASCNTNTVAAGNTCVFYDITSGSIAQVCKNPQGGINSDCVISTSGDTYGVLSGYKSGVGYDLTTGLGSINVTNLVNNWASVAAVPTVTLTPATLTFASTLVGATTAAQVVTLKNTSTTKALAITAGGITFTGTNPTSFIKSTTCGTSLAIGASCTISVAFKPTLAGALSAVLSVADNASGTPQKVSLTGTATSAVPTVTLTPASLAFASTKVGSATAAKVVTLKNTSTTKTLAITAGGITFTGTNPTSFIKSTTCGTSLAIGASCTISVAFKPTLAGALSAVLNVADNATGTPQKVTLTGTGTSTSVPAPVIKLSATAIAFPKTVIAIASDAQIITVSNTGGSTATISSISLGGTNPTDFEQLHTCGATLAAATSCSIYVAFKPASAAAFSAILSVTDNAAGSPHRASITGTGTAVPALRLSATALVFPTTVRANTSSAQTLTLTNSGTAIIDISLISITGNNPTSFVQLDTCTTTLAPAASCTVFVAFTPTTTGALKATLSIASSGARSPQLVPLSGTGK